MSNSTEKRHNLFIQKTFQIRFILSVLTLLLVSGVCSSLLIYWLTGGELLAQAKMAHASLEDPLAHLAFAILLGNVVAMLVSGAATIFVMLYASHKIGGPLYRFEKLCQQVGGGRLDAAPELRAGDQLQDLGKAFQDMVASLRNRQEHRVVSAMKLASVLDQLQKDPDFVDRHLDKLEQMRQTLTQLQE